MSDKGSLPEGPIWLDFSPILRDNLTVEALISVANLALNRLTMRDVGEVFYHAVGAIPDIDFVIEKTEEIAEE